MKKVISTIIMLLFISSISLSQIHVNGTISSGIIKPTEESFKYGFGLDASILFGITQNVDVTLNSGYIKWKQNDKQNSNFRIIPLNIGGRYYLSQNQIRPYAGLELGINIIEHDIWGNYSQLEKRFGYGLNVGFLFSILNNTQLDIGVKYNSIYFDYSPSILQHSDRLQFFNIFHIGFVHSL